MDIPEGLDPAIASRAFRTEADEIAIARDDVAAFLQAVGKAGNAVLGWEAWLVDHGWDPQRIGPVPAKGSFLGLIPVLGEAVPVVLSGSGDATATLAQIESLDLVSLVGPDLAGHVRFNITLDGA